MKCARCFAEVPAKSPVCLRCHTPVLVSPNSRTLPPNSQPFGPTRADNRPLWIITILLCLAVVGMILSFALGRMTQKPAQDGNGPLVQAPGQANPGGLVQAPGDVRPTAPIQAPQGVQPTQPPVAPAGNANPAEIDDYLKFLKEVEARKQRLISKQMADELMMLNQAKGLSATIDENDYNNTFKNTNENMTRNAQEWDQLSTFFNSRQPPAACVDLRNKYFDHLGKIQAAIFEVNSLMSQVQSNPSEALHKLTAMQGKTSIEVDSAIQAADDALYDVCKKYNLRKEFEIKGDSGSGGAFFR
jgi:hypothetical protein